MVGQNAHGRESRNGTGMAQDRNGLASFEVHTDGVGSCKVGASNFDRVGKLSSRGFDFACDTISLRRKSVRSNVTSGKRDSKIPWTLESDTANIES